MSLGHFRDGYPRLQIKLRGIVSDVDIECIVDTGFDGDLALPESLARRLNRVYMGDRERMLADGRIEWFPVYLVTLEWEGEERTAELLVLEGNPLIGTALLEGFLFQVEVTQNGAVSVEEL